MSGWDRQRTTPPTCARPQGSSAVTERGAFLQARRPRTLVLAILSLAVIGLAIGAVVWVQSYQPLRPGNSSLSPSGAVDTPTDNGVSVTFHKGRPFQVGVFVKNTGPFTVHVDSAAQPPALPLSPPGIGSPGNLPIVARVLVSTPLPPNELVGPFTPFRPFDLRPGQTRLILLKGVYGNCKSMGSGIDRRHRLDPGSVQLPLEVGDRQHPARQQAGHRHAEKRLSDVTADDYLRSVSFELRDLPWGQRQDLLTEIRAHLDELPAGTDLRARLGTPKEYAADLRAAAGLERRRGVSAFLGPARPRNLILAALALT